MSRVGKMPIPIPSAAKVELQDGKVKARGPKGELELELPAGIAVTLEDGEAKLTRSDDSGQQRAFHGLARALVANAVQGVTEGFKKELEIVGVGYRADLQGKEIHFALGYSHPIVFPIPQGIEIEVERQSKITIRGADRQQVGQVAAELRALRPPDAYKGKGLRYAGERLRLKVGKAGATT